MDPTAPGPPTPGESPSWRARLPDWLATPSRAAAALGGAAAAVAVAILVLRPQAAPAPQLTLPRIPTTVDGAHAAGTATGSAEAATGVTARGSTVHVAGAVTHPGVYVLGPGSRVADAVAAAGGPRPGAALDRLNLAALVADAQRVWVPEVGEGPGADDLALAPPTTLGLVDLNTATLEQLDALPGIGPATARAILSYRERTGRFASVTDLLDVPGIGPAKLETLRPLVRAG